MHTYAKWLLMSGLLAVVGLSGGCATVPREPLFFDATAWPAQARSVALAGVSFEGRYRPLPQSGLDRELLTRVRQALEAKGYAVIEPASYHRLERTSLLSLAPEALMGRVSGPVDLVVAVHVDYLFSTATYGERNPPSEFEISAAARVIDGKTLRELWRGQGHALAGGAGAMPFPNPDYDRQMGLTELAKTLFVTLPDAGMRPQEP